VSVDGVSELTPAIEQEHFFALHTDAATNLTVERLVSKIFNLSSEIAVTSDILANCTQEHHIGIASQVDGNASLGLLQDNEVSSVFAASGALACGIEETHALAATLDGTPALSGALELSFDLGAQIGATSALDAGAEQAHRLGLIGFGMSGNGRLNANIDIVTEFEIGADMSASGALAGDINDQSASAGTPVQYGTANYSGSGSQQSITGIGFEPDFIIIYDRLGGGGEEVWIADSEGHGPDHIWGGSDTNVFNDTQSVQSFDADGFTLGSSSRGNASGDFYAAICLKMGDQFDIITSPNDGVNGTVLAHDLSSAPVWVFAKHPTKTDSGGWVDGWTLGSEATDSFAGPKQADTLAVQAVTASDITVGNGGLWNPNDAETTPIYLFGDDPVSGSYATGTYTGSGGSGNAITGLGFEPDFVLIISPDTDGAWILHSAMISDALNITDGFDDASFSLDSDGFTVDSGDVNQSGNTYRYFAWA
jgi:hypothetical protein